MRPAANASIHEKAIYAEQQGSHWLAEANEAAERGEHDRAERMYDKSQYWLDRYNRLSGNA